jgi:hypothetical protein
VTYKDDLENRKNARKLAQHQEKQDQPAKLASRKKDLLAHLEKNIRDLGPDRLMAKMNIGIDLAPGV